MRYKNLILATYYFIIFTTCKSNATTANNNVNNAKEGVYTNEKGNISIRDYNWEKNGWLYNFLLQELDNDIKNTNERDDVIFLKKLKQNMEASSCLLDIDQASIEKYKSIKEQQLKANKTSGRNVQIVIKVLDVLRLTKEVKEIKKNKFDKTTKEKYKKNRIEIPLNAEEWSEIKKERKANKGKWSKNRYRNFK